MTGWRGEELEKLGSAGGVRRYAPGIAGSVLTPQTRS
jgi:hypothetical protein